MPMERHELLTKLRPIISSIETGRAVTEAELFQNEVLRPILKFQNNLIQQLFKNKSRLENLSVLSKSDQRKRIQNALEKNTELRHQLTGVIVGLFTIDELNTYLENEAELKRRIKTMLVERLIMQGNQN